MWYNKGRMDNKLKERVEAFIKEYGELVEKHQIDFAHYPVYIPDGAGGFRTTIQTSPVDITPKEEPVVQKAK